MKPLLFLPMLFAIAIAYGQETATTDEGPCTFTVPSLLSPGISEKLGVQSTCILDSFDFKLFNRWGQIVYETDQFTNPLDFNLNEIQQKDGVEEYKYQFGLYIWQITYSFQGGQRYKVNGNITLSR